MGLRSKKGFPPEKASFIIKHLFQRTEIRLFLPRRLLDDLLRGLFLIVSWVRSNSPCNNLIHLPVKLINRS